MPRCPSCGSECPEEKSYCADCGSAVISGSAPTQTSAGSGFASSSHPSLDQARFIPGTVLAGRYRIVGLLGRGGMGEVYRADDLKLGQPVALKFLPESVQQDEARLNRFLNEVRVGLKISHPNVCRIYDIGETEGLHYISMEYVDGEDLASLLRRIGRLPENKAVQIARQLCAGLAAAHEQGILHRDLKPANVMIDGRGRAKITDFGLAGLAEGISGDEVRAGTPQYMAPEQRSGTEVTARSDIYSLGLVLYELFTGEKAYEASSQAELDRLMAQSSPASPTSHVDTLDPAVERVILRCIESDPAQRPGAALAVAASLPGGDPLAAALAAGETPSPEMVAAAGPSGGLRRTIAMTCLAVVILGVLVQSIASGHIFLLPRLPLAKSLEALRENAREIVADLGYAEPPRDSYAEFELDAQKFLRIAAARDPGSGWAIVERPEQTILTVFYRQARTRLVALDLFGEIDADLPPPGAGNISLHLDLTGRLLEFRANPERIDWSGEPAPDAAWAALFEAAGLSIEEFEPTSPTIQPTLFADTRRAWSGTLPGDDGSEVRIEAASCRGKPVWFQMILPDSEQWAEESASSHVDAEGLLLGLAISLLVVISLLLGGAIFLAVRNLKLGRGDRRGAFRLAVFVFAFRLANWILTGHHVASPLEIYLALVALSGALALALGVWLLYVALEPYARRLWPQALVGWNRLLAGRIRDPLVGRDVLVGLATSAGIWFAFGPIMWAAVSHDWLPLMPAMPMAALKGGRFALGPIFSTPLTALGVGLALLLLLLLLRFVLRKTWLAAAGFGLFFLLFNLVNQVSLSGGAIRPEGIVLALINATVATALILFLLLRFGLLAVIADIALGTLLQGYPFIFDSASPFFAVSLIGPIVVILVAIYAFRVSMAGQALFQDEMVSTRTPGRG